MAYNNNIPQPGDQISQSQVQILQNFADLQTLIDVNHVDFASADQGKHKWVTLTQQSAIPPTGSAFGATELGLYNAVNSITTKNELYIKKINQVTTVQIPATASILSTTSIPTWTSSGWTYLPSGILCKWGTVTPGGAGSSSFSFPVSATIPAFSGIFNIQLTLYNSGVSSDQNKAIQLVTATPTTFSVYGSQRTTTTAAIVTYMYFAIGF